MTLTRIRERGQALVMVTLVLIGMCGVLGLAVDLGWSYYVRKSAQASADAAALAAATAGLEAVGQSAPYNCGAGIACQALPAPCPSSIATPSNNLEAGCVYAMRNGFTPGGRQNVTIAAGTSSPPPTAPGVNVYYWVTARAAETIPQLFSAVLGNTWGTSSARATAAIAEAVSPGSLYALNRENDVGPEGRGVDLFLGGGGYIDAGGGIYMASNRDGTGGFAGESNGGNDVYAAFTSIRGGGWVEDPGTYHPEPTNNWPDMSYFKDPMRDKGQPAPPDVSDLPEYPVSGGRINGSNCNNPLVLNPGVYYATGPAPGCRRNCPIGATGQPIQVTGCVTFASGGGFGNYVFFGGLHFPAAGTTVNIAPGRYVIAGALEGNPVFYMHNGVVLTDHTPPGVDGIAQPNTDAGEIFIFTDAFYPGLERPAALSNIESRLRFGMVDIQMGNTDRSRVNLHGLNPEISLPDNLRDFAPVVFWMDQRNSTILYTADGNIDYTSCGGSHSLNDPCRNPDSSIDPRMHLQAHPNLDLFGAVYLPRGADLTFQGHGTIRSPMQVIAGTVSLQGSPSLTLERPTRFVMRRIVSLVE